MEFGRSPNFGRHQIALNDAELIPNHLHFDFDPFDINLFD